MTQIQNLFSLFLFSSLVVEGQIVNPSPDRLLQDETAIKMDSIFSVILQDRFYRHPLISVFFQEEDTLKNSLKRWNDNGDSTTTTTASFLPLNTSTFDSDLDLIASNSQVSNVVLIVPKDKQVAIDVLDKIGTWEIVNFHLRKLEIFVIWPIDSSDSSNNSSILASEIFNASFEQLPQISSTSYIIQWTGLMPVDQAKVNETATINWKVYSIYSAGRNNVRFLTPLSWTDLHCPFSSRRDFNKGVIKATLPINGFVLQQEISYAKNNETGELTERSGFSFNILNYFEQALNVKLEFLFSRLWISFQNGEWSGMAKQLINDEADIAVLKTTYIPFRAQAVRLLNPVFSEGIHAFFRQPDASSIRNIFLQPFTVQLWLAVFVIWILVFVSTVITARIKLYYNQLVTEDQEISNDSLFIAIAFTCQQGWHLDPQSISMRLIFFCGSVIGLIVYVAYSAALVSSLSAVIVPIKTFDDILHNDFSISFEPESRAMESLLNTPTEDGELGNDQVSLLKSKIQSIETSTHGVGLVFRTSAAFLSFSDVFYSLAKDTWKKSDRDLCQSISVVKISKVPFRSGMAVGKQSPYKEYFNYLLLTLYENGLMKRFQRNYILSFNGNCDKQRNKKGVGLGINDVFTAYVIILSGYALAFTIFIIERLHFRRVNAHLINNSM